MPWGLRGDPITADRPIWGPPFMSLDLKKDRSTKSTSMSEILVGSLTQSLNKNGKFLHDPGAYKNRNMRINYLDPGTSLPAQMQADFATGHLDPLNP